MSQADADPGEEWAVRGVQQTPPAQAGRAQQQELSRPRDGGAHGRARIFRASGSDALRVILADWRARRWGITHGALGDKGSGKTWGLREVLRALRAEGGAELSLIVDDKNPRQEFDWGGVYVASVDQLGAALTEGSDTLVIVGDRMRGEYVDVDAVSVRALEIVRTPLPGADGQPAGDPLTVAVVVDEIKRATSDNGKEWTSPAARELVTEGRALRASTLWSTQSPQETPRACVNNSTIALHTMGPNAARYLGDSWCLDPHMVDAIRTLQRGEFVLHQSGVSVWDHAIYRF